MHNKTLKIIKVCILVFSIMLFLSSLTKPAFYIEREDYDAWSNSLILLGFGWSGALAGGAAIAWFANPLIFLSWVVLFKNIKMSVIASIIATALAISFLFFDKVITSEEPSYSKITAYKAGYWLWLSSIMLFTITTAIISFFDKNPTDA